MLQQLQFWAIVDVERGEKPDVRPSHRYDVHQGGEVRVSLLCCQPDGGQGETNDADEKQIIVLLPVSEGYTGRSAEDDGIGGR
ncbi:MAG: hypothetical protein JOZ19_03180 [Rubrobacter sp.]|nr:hypothetical protein [Rubrobacter sp.]